MENSAIILAAVLFTVTVAIALRVYSYVKKSSVYVICPHTKRSAAVKITEAQGNLTENGSVVGSYTVTQAYVCSACGKVLARTPEEMRQLLTHKEE